MATVGHPPGHRRPSRAPGASGAGTPVDAPGRPAGWTASPRGRSAPRRPAGASCRRCGRRARGCWRRTGSGRRPVASAHGVEEPPGPGLGGAGVDDQAVPSPTGHRSGVVEPPGASRAESRRTRRRLPRRGGRPSTVESGLWSWGSTDPLSSRSVAAPPTLSLLHVLSAWAAGRPDHGFSLPTTHMEKNCEPPP